MSRKCAVPSCMHRNSKNDEKRSMFKCPKNELKAIQWAHAIPGLEVLGPHQYVCEKHFESSLISRHVDSSNFQRARLSTRAIPTIFHGNSNNHQESVHHTSNGNRHSIATPYVNNTRSSHDFATSLLNRSLQLPSTNVHSFQLSTLTDTIHSLSATEQILMQIKKEEFSDEPRVKLENSEDCNQNIKDEMDYEMRELTAYDELKSSFDYYVTLVPESWNVARLTLNSDEVFTFSKECTIDEGGALIVMYEKNVVLNKNGNVHYSIHGKMVSMENLNLPNTISDIKSLLDVIMKFNNMQVCLGISTTEFEVDKDFIIFKDDLGYCRHVNCSMVTDTEQCDVCYKYSQYLSNVRLNNTPVLGRPITYCDEFY